MARFITNAYLDFDKIKEISKFRSGLGHDYSDSYESARNMKHYFQLYSTVDRTEVSVYAPIGGVIQQISQENSGGYQIWITPNNYSDFTIRLFHVELTSGIKVGDNLNAGQRLGNHGYGGDSDIAISKIVTTTETGLWDIPTTQTKERLFSYFDLMSDDLFNYFVGRGATSRSDFVISRQERDADPLSAAWDGPFASPGNIPNTVVLK